MKILIATAEKKLFEGEAESIILPTYRGETQILPGHTFLATELAPGTIVVSSRTGGDAAPSAPTGDERFEIGGGIVEIGDDRIAALAVSPAA